MSKSVEEFARRLGVAWFEFPRFGASPPWIASRQERQDSEPISCSRSDPVPAKLDQVTERNVVRKYLTSPLCGWMPSAFMNYGVTGRQQDGAVLQQEFIKKILFAPAILFRQRRIKRPKEALLGIIPNWRQRRLSPFAFFCGYFPLSPSVLSVSSVVNLSSLFTTPTSRLDATQ